MRKSVGIAVLMGICGLLVLASGAFAADVEIGCAIYKFDDTVGRRLRIRRWT